MTLKESVGDLSLRGLNRDHESTKFGYSNTTLHSTGWSMALRVLTRQGYKEPLSAHGTGAEGMPFVYHTAVHTAIPQQNSKRVRYDVRHIYTLKAVASKRDPSSFIPNSIGRRTFNQKLDSKSYELLPSALPGGILHQCSVQVISF